MPAPTFMSATALAAEIRDGSISAVELLQHYLDRCDRLNPSINAIVCQVREQALQAARDADAARARGAALGPLHGVPMTIKESFDLAGTPTTWGYPAWRDNIAQEDAHAVARLKAAGAIVFGKTNVPIALADFQSYNEVYGTTGNPYALDRTPGGSSGGSAAALAAGLCGLEMGSDIGGSIRNPAHFCGVFGHKPTWNMLSMRGHSGIHDTRGPGDISVIGPLARSATDLATVIRQVAGPDRIMSRGYRLDLPGLSADGVRGLRVAVWSDDPTCPVAAEVQARVHRVAAMLADRGAQIDVDGRPAFDSADSHATFSDLLRATMATRMPADDYASLQRYVAGLDPADNSARATVFRAQVASFRDWAAWNEARHRLRWQWQSFFEHYELLVTPIMPTTAFVHDQRPFGQRTINVDGRSVPYFQQTFWAGLSGVAYLPSTIVPTGLSEAGLPIGVQIIGPEYADLITIGVAGLLEADGCRFAPPADAAAA
ncbi:MAG: amidase [Gammaproteobacteria bacterium]